MLPSHSKVHMVLRWSDEERARWQEALYAGSTWTRIVTRKDYQRETEGRSCSDGSIIVEAVRRTWKRGLNDCVALLDIDRETRGANHLSLGFISVNTRFISESLS